jgi:hypothetical protein
MLLLLSRIYRCVDMSSFEGLAQEAVDVTARSLQRAADIITAKSGTFDGLLFNIKHLLILREQISPFEIEFLTTSKRVDFTSTTTALTGLWEGIGSVFTLNSNNAVISFLARGLPSVHSIRVDAKKDIERELKNNCEVLILNVTHDLCGPVLDFLKKASAFSTVSSEHVHSPDHASLVSQPFASPVALMDNINQVKSLIDSKLPDINKKMALYLNNVTTQGILFKPIKDNIIDACARCKKCVEADYSEGDQLTLCQELDNICSMLDTDKMNPPDTAL